MDRQTVGLASWHKREMYILHLALKIKKRNLKKGFLQPCSRGPLPHAVTYLNFAS